MRTDIFSTKRVAVAVVLGGGLALGVAGLAQAADPTPSGSASPSASAPAGSAPGERGGPRGGRGEHKPHLDGTVKTITETTITITDRDGFTRQINIRTKPEGVAVGTRIHAEGAVNADGVSLDATEVKVAPERGAGRPGGGPGHRGGERPGGPRGPLGEGAAPNAPGEPAPSAPGEPAPSAPGEAAPSAPGEAAPSAPNAPAPAAPGAPAPSAPAPSTR